VVAMWTGKDPKTGNVCPVCMGSGYKWRVWIYELMDYTDDIKNLVLDNKSAFEIGHYALSKWMIDLERDGIFKIMKWMTTIDELYRFVRLRNKK
jgi:type II secretory ATPase GspE/PulE/Tfp pilus assembly ATPase PilB-like protein